MTKCAGSLYNRRSWVCVTCNIPQKQGALKPLYKAIQPLNHLFAFAFLSLQAELPLQAARGHF
jgi:hypothetical protein